MGEGLVESAKGIASARPADPHAGADLAPAWFDAPVCRNCGHALATPFCGQCGQKAAKRLSAGDLVKETWERLRLFEKDGPRTIGRLVTSPGLVARDYVRGRRAAHMHPLKLLVALVAILVLLLAANQYFARFAFAGRDADVERMAGRVLTYANWSFTLGIAAVFAGSRIALGARGGYTAIEHGVLAVYAQSLILAVVIVNLLPTLVWRDPAFVLAHKQASAWYLYAIKLGIVAVAYTQFFALKPQRDWPRIALACGIYLAASWLLLRAYAAGIYWFVTRTA